MKRMFALILSALLLVFSLCACAPENNESYNEQANKVFHEFVIQKYNEVGNTNFLIRDIDGDGLDELLLINKEGYSIYRYNDKASEGEDEVIRLANRNKSISSDRFFLSDKEEYPGVFVYSKYGVKTYTYLTLENDKMICQKLWDDDDIGIYKERDQIVKYTNDEGLIKEAQRLYDENMDIEWVSAEVLAFEGTFLSADTSKSDVYNRAIVAYDDFLSGKAYSQPHQSHAIYDMNKDGIPELLYRADYHLYVCTYYNFGVKNIYSSGDAMDGTVKILENSAIFEEHETTGKFYSYTTFGEYNETDTTSFDCAEYDDYSRYVFDNESVSKEKWQELTKKYFEYSKGTEAKIEWVPTLSVVYDLAKERYEKKPSAYRYMGELQKQTQEIISIDGQYYQSYVSSDENVRYIFIGADEYPVEVDWVWNWVAIGTADTYSLATLINVTK